MRTLFNFLFDRKLRIRCLSVFSVCTYRFELIGHLSWRILLTAFLHCPRRRSLWLSQQKSALWIYSFSSPFTVPKLPPSLSLSLSLSLLPPKDDLRGRTFSDEDELQHSVREELRRSSKEFYATGIQRLTQRCKNYVDNEDSVEK
jgi:hypothetical protein